MKKAENQSTNKHLTLWVKACGFTEKMLFSEKTGLLMAQKIATNLMRENSHNLIKEEVLIIQQFLKKMNQGNLRKTISDKECYQIMNMGKRLKRQQFIQRRKIKKSFK